MIATSEVMCPDCGAPMVLKASWRFPYADGSPRRFWGCSRFPECRGIHGAHPDGRPLGVPGDAATKAARIRAHDAFDRLWKEGWRTRQEAYRWMQRALNLTRDEAHIGRFDEAACLRLIERVEREIGESS